MIRVNGAEAELPEPRNLADFIAAQGYNADQIAVELNLSIVPRKDFPAITLKDGDELEILQFMGGG
jgi:thiamine biosynthesis protein ThiS